MLADQVMLLLTTSWHSQPPGVADSFLNSSAVDPFSAGGSKCHKGKPCCLFSHDDQTFSSENFEIWSVSQRRYFMACSTALSNRGRICAMAHEMLVGELARSYKTLRLPAHCWSLLGKIPTPLALCTSSASSTLATAAPCLQEVIAYS